MESTTSKSIAAETTIMECHATTAEAAMEATAAKAAAMETATAKATAMASAHATSATAVASAATTAAAAASQRHRWRSQADRCNGQ
jgi:hypothetical protein